MLEAHTRILAPLLVLDTMESLHSKIQLRMLTLLAQREIQVYIKENKGYQIKASRYGPDGDRRVHGGYPIKASRYGPHSYMLDRDVSLIPSLVEFKINYPTRNAPRFTHSYRITNEGRDYIHAMMPFTEPRMTDLIQKKIKWMCSDTPVTLMEEAYRNLGPRKKTNDLECMVKSDLANTMPQIRKAYKRFTSNHAAVVGEMMETAEMALLKSESKHVGDAQRRVILCMSGEIIRMCSSFTDLLTRSNPLLSYRFADADDLVQLLSKYCEKNDIMSDPMAVPLAKILSKDEVLFLCKAVENI